MKPSTLKSLKVKKEVVFPKTLSSTILSFKTRVLLVSVATSISYSQGLSCENVNWVKKVKQLFLRLNSSLNFCAN